MKRLILAILGVGLLIGCSDKSPTDPTPDGDRLAWCEDHRERCAWYSQVMVKVANSSTVLPGASVLVVNNQTQESHGTRTGFSGETEEIRWSSWPAGSTFWITIAPGSGGGVSWDKWDRKDVLPICVAHPEIDRGVICRTTAEIVPSGIGRAGK